MLTLLISNSDQQKQEMSKIKQIEVQNYIMFSVKLSRTLESSITKSEQDYDTSLLFETSPLYWKDCCAPKHSSNDTKVDDREADELFRNPSCLIVRPPP